MYPRQLDQIMLATSFLFLLIINFNLSLLTCASTGDQNESIQTEIGVTNTRNRPELEAEKAMIMGASFSEFGMDPMVWNCKTLKEIIDNNTLLEELNMQKLVMLIMAASKSNNKALVKQLANHPKFWLPDLESSVEIKCPHSFKVYFDIIENEPLEDSNGDINYADFGIIETIIRSKFKITKTITTDIGDQFEIQSPTEYVELGFASKYEIVLDKLHFTAQSSLVEKMFNDAAKAGSEELTRLIIDHCGENVKERSFIISERFKVSYEVIKILLEHQELIGLLANREVKLYCSDERINPEEVVNFRHVINPNRSN